MFDKISLTRLARMAFAGLVLVLFAGAAAAEDVFEVTGLKIDETATDEVAAKYAGIAKAQRQALTTVLRRIIPPEAQGSLPEVSDDVLATLVRDFDIADEKFGGGRYLATLSVRFLPGEIANTLRSYGMPFAMTRSRSVVVLPVMNSGSATRLWDDPNPWRQAWASVLPNPGLFAMTMPIGDLSDVGTIDETQAVAGDRVALDAIARKYESDGTMVAVATVGRKSNGAVTARVTMTFRNGGFDGTTLDRSYEGSPGAGVPAVMHQVVREIVRELEGTWKSQNVLDFSHQEHLSVLVPIGGLDEWLAIRDRLSSMARVQSVSIARMTREEAEVDMVYVGTTDQLRQSLAQQGLELVYSPGRPLWLLRRIADM